MESFLRKFFPEVERKMKESSVSNYCKFDSQLLTLFTSSLYLAGFVASFFASHVTRAFGRRASMLVGGAASIAGGALGGAAVDVYTLMLGRILLGAGVGFANQASIFAAQLSTIAILYMSSKSHVGFANGNIECLYRSELGTFIAIDSLKQI